tara:strand:- start:14 stop:385 length:372 start_codon:yes stop_codon:yes gene_type:complete
LDSKVTKFVNTLVFLIIWIIGFTVLSGILEDELWKFVWSDKPYYWNFYSNNKVYLYNLPLIVGVIFIAKKFYFTKVTLTKSLDKKLNKNLSNADELKKYSDLKDQGIITEEEFQAKKKKLLDL